MFTKSFIVRLTMPQYSNKKISSETTILKKGYSKKLILVKQKKQSHLILIPPSQGVTLIFWGKKEMCSASPWYTIHNNYDYSCQEILGIVFWSIEGGQKARNVFIMGATFCTTRWNIKTNQIVAFGSCDHNWPIRGMLISNQNRKKALMHMLQSSERFVDGFHFLAKFIVQFICKRKAYTICV